jgi:hypothetical protein
MHKYIIASGPPPTMHRKPGAYGIFDVEFKVSGFASEKPSNLKPRTLNPES